MKLRDSHYRILEGLFHGTGFGHQLMRFIDMTAGRFYPRIEELEGLGLVKSDWSSDRDGISRRMYWMTEAGESALLAKRGWPKA